MKDKPSEIPYLRVGTSILKRVRMPLSNGRSIETLIPWNAETLRQDFGKDYIAKIPKYDGFCTVPSHTDYRSEIHGFLNRTNLYRPHQPRVSFRTSGNSSLISSESLHAINQNMCKNDVR